jgi:mevalonate kinase
MADLSPIGVGQAPGKVILFGEHAVVYGRPAIAVPVSQLKAVAEIYLHRYCLVETVDLSRTIDVATAADTDAYARIVRLVCRELDQPLPAWRIVVRSQIPIASGLGSGAAIAAAIARALVMAFEAELPDDRVSALVYEVEKLHHGTPSGIDNTVVVYEQPVWFIRGHAPEPFAVGAPLHLLIADTGIASPTHITVGDVRAGWQSAPERYEALFDRIGDIAWQARSCIESGDLAALGALMNRNHEHLIDLNVSSLELEGLCVAARSAGALGAKLSGGGRGGNMIALAMQPSQSNIEQALNQAGAQQVLATTIS